MVFFLVSKNCGLAKAIRIHVGPDIKVEVPSEERKLVEQLMEILKQGEAQEHQVGDRRAVTGDLQGDGKNGGKIRDIFARLFEDVWFRL
jgi:hypothetical protein